MARLDLLPVVLFLWVVLVAAHVPATPQHTPEGCYRGQPRSAIRAGFTRTQVEREKCIESCHENGSSVVVLGVNSCWCADADAYSIEDSVDDARCVQCLAKKDSECPRDDRDLHHVIRLTTDEELMGNPPKFGQITAQGCYHTGVRNPMMRGTVQDDKSLLACAKSCGDDGMPLAAVTGRVCYCAESYPSDKHKVPSNRCYMPCSREGDNDRCRIGHAYNPRRKLTYLTVYDTGLGLDVVTDSDPNRDSRPTPEKTTTEISQPDSEPESLSRYTARCYTEPPYDAVSIPLDSEELNNFPVSCFLACKKIERAVAVMRDDMCACAPTYPRTLSATTARKCHIPCRGDGSYSCGGIRGDRTTAFSIYNTGFNPDKSDAGQEHQNSIDLTTKPYPVQRPVTEPRTGAYTSQGCFNMKPATGILTEFEQGNMGFICARFCKHEDRAVAALKGGWCHCSDTYPSNNAKVSDSECSTTCPGSEHQVCGGRDAWSVINTGINLNPILLPEISLAEN
ncbi:hypothetical protein BKA59DRAFT_535507 [Fusarium tricinctum]|uniref:WSC domain-containing protein n=1 Tax=Fusarium tricinctum TaxID=61284 RepID=A0A8K0RQ71_9HYPO|nr:hypothetical protein BKA59DRAFT_535507 [Fusarium tricinctum]